MQPIIRFITPQNRQAVFDLLCKNAEEWLKQGDLQIIIATKKSKRTLEQNKLLWAVYTELAEQAFVDGKRFHPEVWHEYCKGLFIGFNEKLLPDGKLVRQPISTTTLNTEEMTDYINRIMAYGATEFGIEWGQ